MDERNFNYMVFGLAVAWAILFVYVIALLQRGRRLRREIETLRAMTKR